MTDKEVGARITALRKSGKVKEALTLGQTEIKNYPSSWSVRGALAWAIWESKIKNAPTERNEINNLVNVVNEIRTLTDFSLYGEISVYVSAAIGAASILEESGNFQQAIEILSSLDLTQLSITRSSMLQDGIRREIPSQKERWYLAMTKCLDRAEDHTTLETVCIAALASGAFPSERDKIWVKYRLGLSRVDSNTESALELFDEILKSKNDWWLHQQRAHCLRNLERHEEAFQELRIALGGVRPDNIQMAVKLMMDIFELTDDEKMKADLIQALRAIRLANGWKKIEEYEQLAADLGCGDPKDFDFKSIIKQYGDVSFQKTLKRDRNRKHQALGKKLESQINAKVKTLIGDGKNSGFVRCSTGAEYYFSKNDNPDLLWPPEIGQTLVGDVIESFDAKKNKKSARFINGRKINLDIE